MVGSRLPEPVLCIALEAVEKIQGGEEDVGALWSVFSRVKDAVEHGHRLENMSWRLWHCTRAAPRIQFARSFSGGLPRYPEMLPRPLSSPSLSLSSSSEGTATSSDWDHDTAVGEDDEVQGLHSSGARRNTAVSPCLEKPRLDLSTGTRVTETLASHLPRSHQLDSSLDDTVNSRDLPSVSSDSTTPHHPPQAYSDAGTDVSYERGQGTSLSDSLHQCANARPHVAGLKGASPVHESKSPRTATVQDPTTPLATCPIGHSAPFLSSHSRFSSQVLAATASSMPITLPSQANSRKDTISIGRFIADLFPEKRLGITARNMGNERRLQSRGALASREDRAHIPAPAQQVVVTPQIVEPQPSTPAAGRSWFGNPPSSASVTTSATSTPRQGFPTVVVVNPTPHPTPPATPSPSLPDAPYGLKPTATPFERPDPKSEGWHGSANGQLATPVSVNGDARSLSPNEPTVVKVEPKAQNLSPYYLNGDVTVLPSLHPAAAITLPERPNDTPPSHLPTPSSNPHSEMANSSKSTPAAPIPAAEDKKFYLAALHSSSGHESSESPDSHGGGSLSPQKAVPLSGKGGISQLQQSALSHDDEVASSYSAGSPCGRPASITSSRGGPPRPKGRVGFNISGASRRRQGSKRITMAVKSTRKEVEAEAMQAEESESQPREEERTRSKGKERAVGEGSGLSAATERPISPVKSHQPRPSQPPQNLRQLPTNPPRQQTQQPPRRSPSDTGTHPGASQAPATRQLPSHPQLGQLGLGHLPTVPPRQRRPIEITETSSEYDSEGTDDDWTSDEEARGDKSHSASEERRSRTSENTTSRTRDEGEFMRDADREAQKQRELFQKLPARSYSHLGQLPRTKSGLSQLFQPDPELFPDGHPYRTSHSSRDILARNWSMPAHAQPPHAMMAVMQRGSTAGPVQAVVTAESVMPSVNAAQSNQASGSQRANGQRAGYRPRGPPQDQEQETDSGDDDPEDAIQVSSSVAQRRLAAIMGRRPGRHQSSQRPAPARTVSHPEPQAEAPDPQLVTRTTTAPVLMHPFLPDPAPLQTPHTVRRNIIAQELDEELRRNLLWERSQNQVLGRPARAAGSILPGPWRALTPVRPEESRETQSNASDKGPGKRTFATQRTKSWAGDYHAEGW